jgi:hypothetical protein
MYLCTSLQFDRWLSEFRLNSGISCFATISRRNTLKRRRRRRNEDEQDKNPSKHQNFVIIIQEPVRIILIPTRNDRKQMSFSNLQNLHYFERIYKTYFRPLSFDTYINHLAGQSYTFSASSNINSTNCDKKSSQSEISGRLNQKTSANLVCH